jgi:hypothetical protein
MTVARNARRLAVAVLVLAGLLAIAGCARAPQARFVADDRIYTLAEVEKNVAVMSPGPAASIDVAKATEVRQQVLAELRRHGALAGKAADVMTREFPASTQAVPFYVEAATVDGKPCWIFLETWGGHSGRLTSRRLWVFDRDTGAPVESRSFR